jgi:chain length determinant protein EpsF
VTLSQLLRILIARRWIVLGIFATVVLSAVVATLLMPKQYTAVATILADPKAPDPVYGQLAPQSDVATGYIQTQIDIIDSPRTALRVVKILGLDTDPEARIEWAHDGGGDSIQDYFAGSIADGLDVKPGHDSSVISIQYTATNPKVAAATANAFAQAYVDTTSEIRASQASVTSKFFDGRTRQLREAVEKAQDKLSVYEREHGITGDDKLDIESTRLAELSTQLTAVQAVRMESTTRSQLAQGRAGASPDVLQSPVVQGLRTDIARSEAKLNELSERLGRNHPEYLAAAAELKSLRDRLQVEMREVAGSVDSSNTVNLQREAELKNSLDAQRKHVLELRGQHDQIAVLQKDLDEAEKSYDLAAQRLSQSNLESQNQQSSATVLANALVPRKPSRPKVPFNIAVSVLLGLILGLGAAVLRENFGRPLRDADEAARIYGMMMLAVLPSARPVRIAPSRPWSRLLGREPSAPRA